MRKTILRSFLRFASVIIFGSNAKHHERRGGDVTGSVNNRSRRGNCRSTSLSISFGSCSLSFVYYVCRMSDLSAPVGEKYFRSNWISTLPR